jgi:hypothetical protein
MANAIKYGRTGHGLARTTHRHVAAAASLWRRCLIAL